MKYGESITGSNLQLGNANRENLVAKAAGSKILESLKLKVIIRFAYRIYTKYFSDNNGPFLINAVYPFSDKKKLQRKGYTINGIIVHFFIDEFIENKKDWYALNLKKYYNVIYHSK